MLACLKPGQTHAVTPLQADGIQHGGHRRERRQISGSHTRETKSELDAGGGCDLPLLKEALMKTKHYRQ